MPHRYDYELVDFGRGRKLERFGAVLLDRPAPNAGDAPVSNRSAWQHSLARFERSAAGQGEWTCRGSWPDPWQVQWGSCAFELRLGPSGAVGLFPEQAENWEWIRRQVAAAAKPVRVLNLFAYTGASTLAAAAAGASVVHVDAAHPVVQWARVNASQSQQDAAPIRWIVDDARKFVARELRRGRQYQAVILDPPTYGHGPRAEAWQFDTHLPPLLRDCARLMQQNAGFVVLSCHTPNVGPADLADMLDAALGTLGRTGHLESLPLTLPSADGRLLPSGVCARWTVHSERGA